MSDDTVDDQSSHYEISLTAGQAFVAFVLLLLSLAASFAFGLMIGRGQGEDRLVVKHEPSVVTEASVIPKKSAGKIVELGVADSDYKAPTDTAATDTASTGTPVITEGTVAAAATTAAAAAASTDAAPAQPVPAKAVPAPVAAPVKNPEPARAAAPVERFGSVYAQLISTTDRKTAEALAVKAINAGYTAAYVDPGPSTEKGQVFRVRIKFSSEAEARAAEPKLREFAKDVWIIR